MRRKERTMSIWLILALFLIGALLGALLSGLVGYIIYKFFVR